MHIVTLSECKDKYNITHTQENLCNFVNNYLFEYNEGHPWAVIENALINLVCDGELESEDADSVEECLKWAGKSIKSVKRAVSKALKTGKKPYKDVYSEILKMEVEIVEDEYGELTWRELNRKEI